MYRSFTQVCDPIFQNIEKKIIASPNPAIYLDFIGDMDTVSRSLGWFKPHEKVRLFYIDYNPFVIDGCKDFLEAMEVPRERYKVRCGDINHIQLPGIRNLLFPAYQGPIDFHLHLDTDNFGTIKSEWRQHLRPYLTQFSTITTNSSCRSEGRVFNRYARELAGTENFKQALKTYYEGRRGTNPLGYKQPRVVTQIEFE